MEQGLIKPDFDSLTLKWVHGNQGDSVVFARAIEPCKQYRRVAQGGAGVGVVELRFEVRTRKRGFLFECKHRFTKCWRYGRTALSTAVQRYRQQLRVAARHPEAEFLSGCRRQSQQGAILVRVVAKLNLVEFGHDSHNEASIIDSRTCNWVVG